MSKVKRTICDKCHKQIEENEGYYNADISKYWEGTETGKIVFGRGDYCEKCFSEKIVREVEGSIKDE